jgi:hypothetical protein
VPQYSKPNFLGQHTWSNNKVYYQHLGATTPSIMSLNLTTLSIKGLFATLSMKDIQHNNTATMLIVFKLNVVMLSVIMMSIVAPYYPFSRGWGEAINRDCDLYLLVLARSINLHQLGYLNEDLFRLKL